MSLHHPHRLPNVWTVTWVALGGEDAADLLQTPSYIREPIQMWLRFRGRTDFESQFWNFLGSYASSSTSLNSAAQLSDGHRDVSCTGCGQELAGHHRQPSCWSCYYVMSRREEQPLWGREARGRKMGALGRAVPPRRFVASRRETYALGEFPQFPGVSLCPAVPPPFLPA